MASAAPLIVVVAAVNVALQWQAPTTAFPAWYGAAAWSSAGATFVTGVLAHWLPDILLRCGAATAVAGYGVVLVGFPVAAPAGLDRMPWLLTATGAAVAAALVAGGPRLAWTVTAAGATGGVAYRILYGGLDLDGIANDAHALLTSAMICVIGGHVLSIGRGLDAAAADTAAAASREATERGRLAARTRAAALVHDEVLATLALAASDLPLPRGRLAEQADAASRMVVQLADERSGEPQSLAAALAEIAQQAGATFSLPDGDVAHLGDVASEALIGATRQALGNSVRHATAAARHLVLTREGDLVRVEVSDDGPGFDPDRIADDRLGIRQSIIGRMARVDGGRARVISAPGRGTTVVLECAAPAAREWDASGDERALRRGIGVVVAAFVVLQSGCVAMAAAIGPSTAAWQILLLVLVFVAGATLRRSPTRKPAPRRAVTVVALSLLGALVGVSVVPYAYGTLWFAVAYAFLFVALALRGSIPLAVGATVITIIVLIGAGVLREAPAGQIVLVAMRPVTLVAVAAFLLVVVDRMRRRITALHAEAVASAERQSWSLAARIELAARVSELAQGVLPALRDIAGGAPPSAAARRSYATLEGELRDSLRAGSLAREPLVSAVAAARERGVDVVLLDDSSGDVGEDDLAPLVTWMTAAVRTARSSAVGRLLPPGRPGRASMTIDGRLTIYDRVDQGPSVSSFQGE